MSPTKFAALLSKLSKQCFGFEPMIRGGEAAYTWPEVAAALAGGDTLGVDLVLAKYSGDQSAELRAKNNLLKAMDSLCIRVDIPRPAKITDDQLAAMAAFLVREKVDTSVGRCKKCNGTKEIVTRNLRKSCPGCDGTGRKLVRDYIARQCLINRQTFRKEPYIKYYEQWADVLENSIFEALRHGAERLDDE